MYGDMMESINRLMDRRRCRICDGKNETESDLVDIKNQLVNTYNILL